MTTETTTEKPAHWLSEFDPYFTPGNGPKMDPAVKAKWLEALRSGNFNQGTRYLKFSTTGWSKKSLRVFHCCLGILADQAVECGVLSSVKDPEGEGSWVFRKDATPEQIEEQKAYFLANNLTWTDGHSEMVGISNTTMPGTDVYGWSGLEEAHARALAGANDSGRTFAQIADFIDKEL